MRAGRGSHFDPCVVDALLEDFLGAARVRSEAVAERASWKPSLNEPGNPEVGIPARSDRRVADRRGSSRVGRASFAQSLALGVTLLVLLALTVPAMALAAIVDRPAAGEVLSPALAELARPSINSLAASGQARALGIPDSGPGSLLREGGRVLLDVRFDHGAASGLEGLEALGAEPVAYDGSQGTATVAATPTSLAHFESVAGVASVSPVRAPIVYEAGSDDGSACEGGSVVSEGLTQLRVAQARADFGLRGAGVTVGVLSDSFDSASEAEDGSGTVATHAAEDVLSGDLPGSGAPCAEQQDPVDVLEEAAAGSGGNDEGRAMLQIVHDLAPEAKLAFATALGGEEVFARNIERLAAPVVAGGAGADVIVDDVSYLEEPFFQDGPIADAIAKVTAEGVTYLSAAGNDNLFEGQNEIASWEAPSYRDSGGCPAAVQGLSGFNGTHCMDFDPGAATDRTFGMTVAAGATLTVDLQWAEPWNGVATDLDAFLLNAKGELIADSAETNVGPAGTQRPLEIVQWKNATSSAQSVQLAINRFAGTASPRLKFVLTENGTGVTHTEYPTSGGGDVVGPTIFGHAGSPQTIAVGAVPFSSDTEPEPYSSRGPVTHYFGPVEGSGAAAPLSAPQTIAKPDLAATDCGATTFFAQRIAGVWRFCGTSAAAPHAAAVAALVREADPTATPAQVRDALTATAVPVGSFPPEAVGAGLVDAEAAVGAVGAAELPAGERSTVVTPPPASAPQAPLPAPLVHPTATEPGPPPTAEPTILPSPAAPPDTYFKRHPAATVRSRRATAVVFFLIASHDPVSAFLCSIDGGAYRPRGARIRLRLGRGRHVVRVKARDASGVTDPTPVSFRFRVTRSG